MSIVKLSQKSVESLPGPDPTSSMREREYADSETRGLHLIVSSTGYRRFVFRKKVNGRKFTVTLGEQGPLTLQDARRIANEYKSQLYQGKNPFIELEEKKSIPLFKDFALERYLEHSKACNRSAHDNELRLRSALIPVFGSMRLDEITTAKIQAFHNQAKTRWSPATANRVFALMHRILQLAVLWGVIEKNPATGIRKFQENNLRKRYLSPDEIQRFVLAANADTNQKVAKFLLFLLFTGIRKGEAIRAQWTNVDLGQGTLWLPTTKAGQGRHVVLNSAAIDLLKNISPEDGNPFVFPGRIKGKRLKEPRVVFLRILSKAGIENFRIHDLRHCFASLAVSAGASLYTVQSLLGHKHAQTTARYAHLSDEAQRSASHKVASAINAAAFGTEN